MHPESLERGSGMSQKSQVLGYMLTKPRALTQNLERFAAATHYILRRLDGIKDHYLLLHRA